MSFQAAGSNKLLWPNNHIAMHLTVTDRVFWVHVCWLMSLQLVLAMRSVGWSDSTQTNWDLQNLDLCEHIKASGYSIRSQQLNFLSFTPFP